jgi:hypothetical protein
MAGRDLSRLCRSVLPAGFERMQRELPRVQAFLDANLPQAVSGQVTLLSIGDDQIVIAASTPMVTNYLRLHGAEIAQQLRETFRLEQAIRFRTVPDALMQQRKTEPLRPPRAVGGETVEAIRRNAQWIEDDSLRAALLSLAESLQKQGE